MNFTSVHEKLLASAEFGPAVLRLRLLEIQLILRKANLTLDIRERAQQAALDLRRAIAERPCISRLDYNAKLSLLLETDAKGQASRLSIVETIKEWCDQANEPVDISDAA